MPRKLPWSFVPAHTGSSRGASTTGSPASRPARLPRRSSSPSNSLAPGEGSGRPAQSDPRASPRVRRGRSSSMSPPPLAPPPIEFMREGSAGGDDNDDTWIMVEDEFLSTAQLFTAHLHRAEYVRLRGLARKRDRFDAAGGAESSTGQLQAEQPAERARKLLRRSRKLEDEGSEDEGSGDEDMALDPRLAALMAASNTDRGAGRDLRGVVSMKAKTRAAAGCSQRSRPGGMGKRREREGDEDDEDDDDLDVPPRESVPASLSLQVGDKTGAAARTEVTHFQTPRTAVETPSSSVSKVPNFTLRSTDSRDSTSPRGDPGITLYPAEVPSTSVVSQHGKGSRAAAMIAQRRRAKEERNKQLFRSDDIPTFLA